MKRKQLKDPRLVRLQMEMGALQSKLTVQLARVRRAWRKFDKLAASISRLQKRMGKLESELSAATNGGT